jgi:fermentation-respiration switch protein FrsA (DUF1100 family)
VLWKHRLLALIVVVAVGVAVRFLSRRWLFPVHAVASSAISGDAARRTFAARDGTLVHALDIEAPPAGRTIVYFHSNRETVEATLDLAAALHARGFGVLLVEYRGYGISRDGSPSEEGLYLDAEAALDWLAQRGITPDRIVLWGTSLGTGIAAEMASRGRGSQLILVTPYTSIPALVTNVVPIVPARLLLADRFDTLAKASRIRIPTTVVHGDADEIVPFWMGEKIAQSIPGARFVRVAGGHHGDLLGRESEGLLTKVLGPRT